MAESKITLMIMNSHAFLAISWMLYCFLHSLLADLSFKKKVERLTGSLFQYYRLAYTIFAFAGLIFLVIYQYKMSSRFLFEATSISRIAGWMITISGALVMLVCIKKYFLSLSGLLSLFKEPARSRLMVSGIHKYIRHPLYLGTFMFIWGGFLLLPYLSILISNTVITLYTLYGIRLEEKKLVMEYGEDYIKYRAEVPGLIPFTRNKSKS